MRLKPGVSLRGIQPEIVIAILCAETVLASYGTELVITSVADGKHGENSLHYKGLAVDIRTRNLTPEGVAKVASELQSLLGSEFDVVVESDHLHVEFDPI